MNKLELRKELLALYREGFSDSEIALALGIDEFDVRYTISRFGKTADKRKATNRGLGFEVFKLKFEGLSIIDIANELSVSQQLVQDVIDNDQAKIQRKSNWVQALSEYRTGKTLQEIGETMDVSREAIRQVIKKQLYVENGFGPIERTFHEDEIETQLKEIVAGSSGERIEESVRSKINEGKSKGIEPEYFESPRAYAAAIGADHENLKNFAPDIYSILARNAEVASRKWHKYYLECRMCHTTQYKHKGMGYCDNCYTKSDEWKLIQKRSHLRRKDEIAARMSEYSKEYSQRPEVKARIEKYWDNRHFGGNRKSALERDNYLCIKCGKDMTELDKAGKPKVRVWHINGVKEDNRLENLGTYCLSCYTKYIRITPFNGFIRHRK